VERSGATRSQLALTFTHPGVADAYRHRPPYPAQVFDLLDRLITDQPRAVLDLGAGEGAIARPLASRVEHVDAVDLSAAMIAAGQRRPGGRRPNLRWIAGAAETAPLDGPYALVTAGASLHWMAWAPTFTRLLPVLTPHAQLAIVDQAHPDVPWAAQLRDIIRRHSRSTSYDPGFSLPDELAARGLLQITGRAATDPVPFRQPAADYVEQFHSTSSLAREWMTAAEAAAFDQAVTQAVAPHATDGIVEFPVVAELTWGRISAG
jgi:ubiquinone/menaquinone biosynthesis C-methylase UbiE